MTGKIERVQLLKVKVVNVLIFQAGNFAEETIMPQHCNLIATQLHIGLHAVDGVTQCPIKSTFRILGRFLVRPAMSKYQTLLTRVANY
jgi:hypothetical protein